MLSAATNSIPESYGVRTIPLINEPNISTEKIPRKLLQK